MVLLDLLVLVTVAEPCLDAVFTGSAETHQEQSLGQYLTALLGQMQIGPSSCRGEGLSAQKSRESKFWATFRAPRKSCALHALLTGSR